MASAVGSRHANTWVSGRIAGELLDTHENCWTLTGIAEDCRTPTAPARRDPGAAERESAARARREGVRREWVSRRCTLTEDPAGVQ